MTQLHVVDGDAAARALEEAGIKGDYLTHGSVVFFWRISPGIGMMLRDGL